jgi:hypothetical protein
MDSLITAAAQALAVGDVLAALKRVALRDDAPALGTSDLNRHAMVGYRRLRLLTSHHEVASIPHIFRPVPMY